MRFNLSRCIRLQAVPLVLLSLGIACGAPVLDSTDVEITDTQPTQNAAPVTGDPVYFGVLAIDSAVSVNERYGPLLNYLSTEIGRPVELVILSQESQFTKVAEEALDFTTNNPLAAVQIQRLYDTEFLVTHTRPKTGAQFSGLIVVNANSDMTSIQDLKGRKAACVNFQTAAAGCTFQIYHLLQNGFDPYKDFSSFVENKSQDNIVLALLNNTIDVGFIRTGQLEKMVKKGLLTSQDEVRIIDVVEDDFFYSHTTDLYPEWPIAKLPDTDPQLVEQVQSALISIPSDHPALESLRVEGFVPAVDYSRLDNLIETLQLKSWDAN
ncbi:phosphate/phosphite/phosphonate ABC transporter substrate-binding protein [Leptolyngbyaceae cyanobacterium CCMR0081]|uniref:Phosphate/phosphite/phosphonate ABC transporter substrate-binding protein n=1 Tax=Adonisia turfae CCMR0081 TaxID=2292702 RepID=A0A6M0RXQ7_9CYAN|nr:phosphate/phosphite/phosphonate ABC transporter substrate-binding protein [Adonisia turfae]NEZ60964.1 phosphate/phosphite/phosphonate ABC transporter substrate-binding protein [Adonisia turfae CCMR0081]